MLAEKGLEEVTNLNWYNVDSKIKGVNEEVIAKTKNK